MINIPFFGKKKSEVLSGRGSTPTERVREMASRGFSEPEMIDVLRREGYSALEIDNALSDALKIGVNPEHQPTPQPQPVQQQIQKQNIPQQNLELPTWDEISRQSPRSEPEQLPQIPETSLPDEYYTEYPNEEYIDFAIQTRMGEIDDRMKDFKTMNENVEKKMDDLKTQLSQLSKLEGGGDKEIKSRLEGLNETITDLDGRMSGLEKAFKDTLPALIESVRNLSELVQRFKKEV